MSKGEARGLVILIPLVIVIILFPYFMDMIWPESQVINQDDALRLDEFISEFERQDETSEGNHVLISQTHSVIYRFDPHTVTRSELISFGVASRVASNWINYVNNGGKFYKKEDIGKIYGMDGSSFDLLVGFVDIKAENSSESGGVSDLKDNISVGDAQVRKTKAVLRPFDINLADTMALRQLKGIGPAFSRRIVKYRDKLGGYVNLRQLREVYGLHDSVLVQMDTMTFIAADFTASRVDVNHADAGELARHPYLTYRQAQALVAYRFQHGDFESVRTLHNIHGIDSLTITKIAPYLEF